MCAHAPMCVRVWRMHCLHGRICGMVWMREERERKQKLDAENVRTAPPLWERTYSAHRGEKWGNWSGPPVFVCCIAACAWCVGA